jgi:hypothetical protein
VTKKVPNKITEQFIIQNKEYFLESRFHQWKVYVWKQIVLLVVAANWDPNNYGCYFKQFWDLFYERRRYWDLIYFVIDTNNMPIRREDFRGYVKENWSHLLNQHDLCICIVESNTMKRLIWFSIYQLMDKQYRIKIFKNHERVFSWVQRNCALNEV